MLHFIIVYHDSPSREVYLLNPAPLKNIATGSVTFICRKENIYAREYGEHVLFTFCDTEGNDLPFEFDNYKIVCFRVYGSWSDRRLAWIIEHSGQTEEYILHRDDRGWVAQGTFDREWDTPVKDTLRLIRDIKRMGFETRKEIDTLKRILYKKDCEVELLANRYNLYKNFDLDLSGTPLEGKSFVPSHGLFDFKDKIKEKHLLVSQVIPFLKHEIELREISAAQLERINDDFLNIISSRSELRLKDGVNFVHQYQFDYCSKVETIFIPGSVDQIVCTAFNYKDSLKSVYIESAKKVHFLPPLNVPSGSVRTNAKFYVPKDLVESYKKQCPEVSENFIGI